MSKDTPKKSILRKSPRSPRSRKNIRWTENDIKEFVRDFEPENKHNLWTTRRDVENATLESFGVSPSRYRLGDKVHVRIVDNENKKIDSKNRMINEFVKKTIKKKREERENDPDAITLIKRQPELTKGMIMNFQRSMKKGGKNRKVRHTRKRV